MATLVSDVIQEAFIDLGVVAAGESTTTTMKDDAFLRLNQMLGSLGASGVALYNELIATFAITGGVGGYTFGVGGNWNTAARAQKIVAWKFSSGVYTSGGHPLTLSDFDAQAQAASIAFQKVAAEIAAMVARTQGDISKMVAEVTAMVAQTQGQVTSLLTPFFQAPTLALTPSPLVASIALSATPLLASAAAPLVLGSDVAYPLINVRVFPAIAGNVDITYWTPFAPFAASTDALSMAPGIENLLHFLLAQHLYPQYPRPNVKDHIWAMAGQARAYLSEQSAIATPQPQTPPPAPAAQ